LSAGPAGGGQMSLARDVVDHLWAADANERRARARLPFGRGTSAAPSLVRARVRPRALSGGRRQIRRPARLQKLRWAARARSVRCSAELQGRDCGGWKLMNGRDNDDQSVATKCK